MDDGQFWALIEQAQGDADKVKEALVKLEAEDIQGFHRLYWEKHNSLHRWDVWGAAYVVNGGCSDDSFHYFKAFAIGKGKAFYEALHSAPDSIGDLLTEEDEDNGFDNELLNYAADEAFEEVEPDGELESLSKEGEEPSGDAWEEEDLPKLFPSLWKKYGEE